MPDPPPTGPGRAAPGGAGADRAVVAAVSAGGVLGAEARYGLGVLLAQPSGAVPWATLLANASGCLLIGALMAVLGRAAAPPRLARPFLGVGVLGGYTTFSAYAVDAHRLAEAGRPLAALGYVLGTLAAALSAVWLGTAAARRVLR
nr:fluoride efflux transporter CrcB [Motilibacter aurantiacus]